MKYLYSSPLVETVNGGAGQTTPEMTAAWLSYFDGVSTNTVIDWAGGKMIKLDADTAYLAAPDAPNGGVILNRYSIDNPSVLQMLCAMVPDIAIAWAGYGIKADTGMARYYAESLAQQVALGLAGPAIAVHGGDVEANAAWYVEFPKDELTQYVYQFGLDNPDCNYYRDANYVQAFENLKNKTNP